MFSKKGKILRYWDYKLEKLNKLNSFKIAHTALVVKKQVIKKLKFYNIKYSIASDTDFILRMSNFEGIKYKKIDKNFILMEAGGLSNSYKNLFLKISQDLEIFFRNFKLFFLFIYFFKIFYKLFSLIKWRVLK